VKIAYWTITLLICFIAVSAYLSARNSSRIVRKKFRAHSLEGNCMEEDPDRSVSVYLPPGYSNSTKKYPVLYFLHGYNTDDITLSHFRHLLDKAISGKVIPPLIVVAPSSYTRFYGSFYTNSEHAGRWADYIGRDLVQYIEANYRTIHDKGSRGVAGHSMGGNGALKMAMLFPDVFGSVYALSPSILYWAEELSLSNPAFKKIQEAGSIEDVRNDQYSIGFLSVGSTYSANPLKMPFRCDMPVYYEADRMMVDSPTLQKWEREFPLMMVDSHLEALRKLKGIAFDWGNHDEFAHLPVTCRMLDQKLKAAGIPHMAEEYEGSHGDRIVGDKGRIYMNMIPFFSKQLAIKN
jgi:enterochelin esterase-like enzyme